MNVAESMGTIKPEEAAAASGPSIAPLDKARNLLPPQGRKAVSPAREPGAGTCGIQYSSTHAPPDGGAFREGVIHTMFFDSTIILVFPALILAMWAQWRVQSTYQKMSRVRAANGMTGREMARAIMTRNGISDVEIEEVGGVLSDHYDPRAKKVRLSTNNYRGDSLASIAVAAHEVGHVMQHASGYAPLVVRSAIAPVAGFASGAAFPLFFIGLFFRSSLSLFFMDLGILLFSGALLFQLVTLPVEFNASKRALVQLTETGSIAPQEMAGAKKVLDAAALTYVAAAAMAALQLVRLLLIRDSRR
jgi:Zn-dependent membrane protease YugP